MFPRISRIVEKKKEIDFAAQNDEFGDDMDSGDQAMGPAAINKTNNVSKSNDDSKLKEIILAMEKAPGMGCKVFHSLCLDTNRSGDKMPFNKFLVFFNTAYPNILVPSVNYLVEKI